MIPRLPSTMLMCLIVILHQTFAHFGYTQPEQKRWARHHSHCAGKHQSPIAVHSNLAITLQMPAIEMVGYHNLLPGPIKLHNNGHSVSMSIPKVAPSSGQRLPYIFGGRLKDEYELEGLHFHWGDKNNRGSEHQINDIRYAMEMHIIHRNRKYSTMSEALDNPDGLCVLAFFYQLDQHDSPELLNIVHNLVHLQEYDRQMLLNSTFTLQSLLGKIDTDIFYTYQGSLTTPPCSEAVLWVLFPDPLPVTNSQMFKFRQLSNGIDSVLVDNFRTLQPLGRRRVFLRKIKSKRTYLEQVDKQDIFDIDWLAEA